MGTAMYQPDDDLSPLCPEDLYRVCRWAEDRLVNAVTPFAIRLQGEMAGGMCGDHTLAAAQWAVTRVLAAVEEIRRIVQNRRIPSGGDLSLTSQYAPPIPKEMPRAAGRPEASRAD
jgi:hypothetical protein